MDISLAVSCHFFLWGPRLPFQLQSVIFMAASVRGEQRNGCERLAEGCCAILLSHGNLKQVGKLLFLLFSQKHSITSCTYTRYKLCIITQVEHEANRGNNAGWHRQVLPDTSKSFRQQWGRMWIVTVSRLDLESRDVRLHCVVLLVPCRWKWNV